MIGKIISKHMMLLLGCVMKGIGCHALAYLKGRGMGLESRILRLMKANKGVEGSETS